MYMLASGLLAVCILAAALAPREFGFWTLAPVLALFPLLYAVRRYFESRQTFTSRATAYRVCDMLHQLDTYLVIVALAGASWFWFLRNQNSPWSLVVLLFCGCLWIVVAHGASTIPPGLGYVLVLVFNRNRRNDLKPPPE